MTFFYSDKFLFSVFVVFLLAVFLAVFIFVFLKKRRLARELHLKLMLIRLPQLANMKDKGRDLESKREERDEIKLTEQLMSALVAFKTPIIFEVAVPHVGEEISFYIAVPGKLQEAVARQVQSLWTNADVHTVEDYNIFNHHGATVAGYLKLNEMTALPLRTYGELRSDTFLPMLGGLSKINVVGEGCAIQVIMMPAKKKVKKGIKEVLEKLKKGDKLRDLMSTSLNAMSRQEWINVFTGSGVEDEKTKHENSFKAKNNIVDETAIKAVELKLSKPLVRVNVRIIASAPSAVQADAIFQSITAGYAQFQAPDRNELKVVKPGNIRSLIYRYSFREFSDSEQMLLNLEELASLFHLPISQTTIPRIKYLKSKESAPPPALVTEGVVIGDSLYRSERKPVHISDDDRRRHIYIIGQTGTGKTNLITNMAIDDIRRGKGVGIIDPHGELVDTVLGLVPPERENDVIVFDPGDTSRPLGLNMLEYDHTRPEEKTFIVNEMQGIFNKLFAQETMGPMFEQYMRNALLLLMEDSVNSPATIMEVSRVFTDDDFREEKLERISNPAVIDFWEKEAVRAGGEAALSNMTPYITSKFNNFTANDYVRPIIGQVKSAFSFREAMDSGKILLVNLSKGRIGDINANLLGMIVVGKLLMAALGRVNVESEARRDFNLFIDEFQNFTTDSISTILSEARKYRLNLTIAHQFIAQLSEKIRDSVFGNVGSLISLRVGAQDAEHLVKQFSPEFSEHDLMNIDNGNAYVKLLMRGQPVKPFNIKIPFAPKGDIELSRILKLATSEKYGRPRDEVESEIYERLRD